MGPRPPHQRKAEFEEVALPFLDALFNLALHLTRNRKDAEDLVQETYLRAFRFFDSYRPGTHVKAWLFRILRNTFINRYRAARARPDEVDLAHVEAGHERFVDAEFLRAHSPVTPEARLVGRTIDAAVQRALDALPEEFRTVVILALIEELSYREIASVLSIPIGTVMSRLHRGRKQLRAVLADHARRAGIIRPADRVSGDESAGGGEEA
jgi:RNA polymerase sigma-70 factor (ECF subfamily)